MKYRTLIGVVKNKYSKWEEEIQVPYIEDAEQAYKEVIEAFNESLRPGELPREFVSASWKEEKGIIYCDFEKQNCGTLKDSVGYYDKVKCRRCGRVKRRRSINSYDVRRIKCKMQD